MQPERSMDRKVLNEIAEDREKLEWNSAFNEGQINKIKYYHDLYGANGLCWQEATNRAEATLLRSFLPYYTILNLYLLEEPFTLTRKQYESILESRGGLWEELMNKYNDIITPGEETLL